MCSRGHGHDSMCTVNTPVRAHTHTSGHALIHGHGLHSLLCCLGFPILFSKLVLTNLSLECKTHTVNTPQSHGRSKTNGLTQNHTALALLYPLWRTSYEITVFCMQSRFTRILYGFRRTVVRHFDVYKKH